MISLERRATHNHDRKISWSRLLPDCSSSSSAQLHSNLKCLFPFYARNPCALFPSRQADEAANSWSKSRSVRNPNTRIAAQLRVPSMWWQNLATGCFFFLYWNPSPRSTPPTPIPPHSSWWLVDGGKSLSCSQSHLNFKCGENTRFHVLLFRNTNVAFIGRCFCRRRWRHSLYGLCCAYSRSASSSQLTILVKCEFL